MAAAAAIEFTDPAPTETTLVELVLSACDWSEDQGEIADLVDSLIDDGVVRLTGVAPEPAIFWPASHRPR